MSKMNEKTALLWPFKYGDVPETFATQMKWVAKALQSLGYEVTKAHGFQCEIDGVQEPSWPYNWDGDVEHRAWGAEYTPSLHPPSPTPQKFDIIIYSHSDEAEIKNRERHGRAHTAFGELSQPISRDFPPPHVQADATWFFKSSSPPNNLSATLDTLGYGSYSSMTYEKPPFETVSDREWKEFYDTKVKRWLKNNENKWGENHFQETEVEEDDYYLILGQCFQDAVLTRQDFGGFFEKIHHIIDELLKVDRKRHVIVKLHPYTNHSAASFYEANKEPKYRNSVNPLQHPSFPPGTAHESGTDIAGPLAEYWERLDRVKVYKGFESAHSFIAKARCVFVGNSGAGYDAMMHDVPIISFCQPEYHWVTYDLRKKCDLRKALETEEWFRPNRSKKFLYWFTEKYCFYSYETALRRINDLLKGK